MSALLDWLEARFGDYAYGTLRFRASGEAPSVIFNPFDDYQRPRSGREWQPLVPFTGLTFPA